jgi:histone deacetylase 1/2
MNKEMAIIESNQTWTLVDLSTRCSQVLTKWLFKFKHEPEGIPIKYKACLVAHRFEQQEGIEYQKVFALVAGWTTIHIVIVVAFHTHGRAFLNRDIKEDV